jgi:predicted dehydrogenase
VKSKSGVDVSLSAEMSFNGIDAQLHCDMREDTEREITFEVKGRLGTLIMDQYVHPYRGFTITLSTPNSQKIFTENDGDADYHRSTYAYQLDHVIKVIQGRAHPLTGGEDAVETMRGIDALYHAAGFDREFQHAN